MKYQERIGVEMPAPPGLGSLDYIWAWSFIWFIFADDAEIFVDVYLPQEGGWRQKASEKLEKNANRSNRKVFPTLTIAKSWSKLIIINNIFL